MRDWKYLSLVINIFVKILNSIQTNCGFFDYFSASSGHPFLQNGPTVARLRATVPDKFRQFIWQHCCSYPSNILWYLSWCLWNYCWTISFSKLEYLLKVKKILKGSLVRSHHLHFQWKLKLWTGKFAWGICKGKKLLGIVNK